MENKELIFEVMVMYAEVLEKTIEQHNYYNKTDFKIIEIIDDDISIGGERYIGCPICKEYKMILYKTPPYRLAFETPTGKILKVNGFKGTVEIMKNLHFL